MVGYPKCLGAIAAALVALLCSAGCGEITLDGDGGSGPDTGRVRGDAGAADDADTPPCTGTPIPFDELAAQYLYRICEFQVRCQPGFTDVDHCVEVMGPDFSIMIQRMHDSVQAGRIIYDGCQGQACIDEIDVETCTGFEDNSCAGLMTGTIAPGDVCFVDEECEGNGGRCDGIHECRTQCCSGSCVAPAGMGEDCDYSFCEAGAYCVQKGPGDAFCSDGEIGSPCFEHDDCREEYHCDAELRECAPDAGAGDPCGSDEDCDGRGLLCAGDDTESAAMAECSNADHPGAPCDTHCLGRFFCDRGDATGNGACRELPELNEPCDAAGMCQPPYICWQRATGPATCDHRLGRGEQCRSFQCETDLFCLEELDAPSSTSRCVQRRPDGQQCTMSSHCESYNCVGGRGMGGDDGGNEGEVSEPGVCEPYQACF